MKNAVCVLLVLLVGGTAEARKFYLGQPPCRIIVAGDINGDCIVDFKDFAIMAYHWLEVRS